MQLTLKAIELSASTNTLSACTAMAVIAWLYILTNAARVFTYIPQLLAVWHSEDGARDVSLLTWSSWVVSNATGVAYGALVINDRSFTLIALLNMVCCGAVALIGADRRGLLRWRRSHGTPRPSRDIEDVQSSPRHHFPEDAANAQSQLQTVRQEELRARSLK